MPGLETVSMGIWNYVGGRDETKDINGVAHLLEHMAFKGTKTKNALEIAETIENVGGDINAYTSKEYTYVPWKTICLIVAGLIYFIYPVDLIPDFIPVSGLIDDIALIAWIYESIQDDIDNFLEWEKSLKS